MRFLSGVLESMAGAVAAAIIVGFTSIMIVDVFSRYVLAVPLPWAPELSILLFQLTCFIGAAIALRRGMHFGLGLVFPVSGSIMRRAIAFGVAMIVLGCSIYLIRYGWNLTLMTSASNYPTLPFSHNVIYIGLIAGSVLMAVFAVEQGIDALTSDGDPPVAGAGDPAHPVVKDQ